MDDEPERFTRLSASFNRFRCTIGLHSWSNWEWGRWSRYHESYRQHCQLGCGTYREKNLRTMVFRRDIERFEEGHRPFEVISRIVDGDKD